MAETMKSPAASLSPTDGSPVGSRDRTIVAYEIGPYLLDVAARQVTHNGERVPIFSKAFDTLFALVRNHDRVVTKDELVKLVWPDSFVSDESLTQAVSQVRRALGSHDFVATIPRHGYRFIGPVHEHSASGPIAPQATDVASGVNDSANEHSASAAGRTSSDWAAIVLGPFRSRRQLWKHGPVLAGLILAAWGLWGPVPAFLATSNESALTRPVRFVQEAPPGTRILSGGALSPDGRYLAFVAEDTDTGETKLWVRTIDTGECRSLPETAGATKPFWSPESEFIGYFADGGLETTPLRGGPPRRIAPLPLGESGARLDGAGGTWNRQGVILFATWRTGLKSVHASGGPVDSVTQLDPRWAEVAHEWPQFLPDGKHFLFFVNSQDPSRSGTYLGTLGSFERVRLLDGSMAATIYTPPGYFMYVNDTTLMVQGFDPRTLKLVGTPSVLVDRVSSPNTGNGVPIAAAAGLLAYRSDTAPQKMVWFNRDGRELAKIDGPPRIQAPVLSVDGKHLVADSENLPGVWLFDLSRDTFQQFLTEGETPLPSPDGTHLAFTSNWRKGGYIYQTTLERPDQIETLLRTNEPTFLSDWSHDGRHLVYNVSNTQTGEDIWMLPMSGDRRPTPYLQHASNEFQGTVSPDNHWLAYTSDESGSPEVYIQSFPLPGAKQRVSSRGGAQPRWSGDGKELFYLEANRTLMALDVIPARSLVLGRPRPLFQIPLPTVASRRTRYAVAQDSQSFIFETLERQDSHQGVTVVANWSALLRPQSEP